MMRSAADVLFIEMVKIRNAEEDLDALTESLAIFDEWPKFVDDNPTWEDNDDLTITDLKSLRRQNHEIIMAARRLENHLDLRIARKRNT